MLQRSIEVDGHGPAPTCTRPIEGATPTPGGAKAVAETKRFLERWQADPEFRSLARRDPERAARAAGVGVDPREFRALWLGAAETTEGDDSEPTELLLAYRDYVADKIAFRDRVKTESDPIDPRLSRWRTRQIARGSLELGPGRMRQLVQAPFAVELCKGCSVGCWFCGVSAPKLGEILPYDEDGRRLWRGVLRALGDVLGSAARWGFCYWATDPLDNPDYERFCVDFHDVLGTFPQTTTALALRDPQRTRRLLRRSEDLGCPLNRFSILSARQLLRMHELFAPEELLRVECLLQNPGSTLTLGNTGRARERNRARAKETGEAPSELPSTIACVSGFLLNLIDRTLRLVTPCAATDRRPLGYAVIASATFRDADEVGPLLRSMIDPLPDSPTDLPRLGFADFLAYDEHDDGFELTSAFQRITCRDDRHPARLRELGRRLRGGGLDHDALALTLLYGHGVPIEATAATVEELFRLGALQELPS